MNTAAAAKAGSRRVAARPGRPDVAQSADGILDVAECLLQTRGYNGFSYADIAKDLGVTKAGLHYHFATKAALGRALIDRYNATFAQALAAIDAGKLRPCEQLQSYIGLYESVIGRRRMCLCGMLAAEVATLPAAMQRRLNAFFDENEAWLARVLDSGRAEGELQFSEMPLERARGMIGALEGALLVARVYGDPQRFRAAADQVIAAVCPQPLAAARGGTPRTRARRPRAIPGTPGARPAYRAG